MHLVYFIFSFIFSGFMTPFDYTLVACFTLCWDFIEYLKMDEYFSGYREKKKLSSHLEAAAAASSCSFARQMGKSHLFSHMIKCCLPWIKAWLKSDEHQMTQISEEDFSLVSKTFLLFCLSLKWFI